MLRLRQICLVAPELEPAVDAVRSIFDLEVCHRDSGVAKYGLVNALFVFGHQFLEIVAPTREGTAAGRFLERSGGRGGYMAIFDTHDPERRREHVLAMGIRIAHEMDYPGFRGIQLHPRDGRATMLEFDRSIGNESLDGAYWPAGAHWQAAQRLDRVRGIPWIDVESPDPADLAAHWSRIIGVPVGSGPGGVPELTFDLGGARFIRGAPGSSEAMTALHVEVDCPVALRAAASAWGLELDGDGDEAGFALYGVRFVPHAAAAAMKAAA